MRYDKAIKSKKLSTNKNYTFNIDDFDIVLQMLDAAFDKLIEPTITKCDWQKQIYLIHDPNSISGAKRITLGCYRLFQIDKAVDKLNSWLTAKQQATSDVGADSILPVLPPAPVPLQKERHTDIVAFLESFENTVDFFYSPLHIEEVYNANGSTSASAYYYKYFYNNEEPKRCEVKALANVEKYGFLYKKELLEGRSVKIDFHKAAQLITEYRTAAKPVVLITAPAVMVEPSPISMYDVYECLRKELNTRHHSTIILQNEIIQVTSLVMQFEDKYPAFEEQFEDKYPAFKEQFEDKYPAFKEQFEANLCPLPIAAPTSTKKASRYDRKEIARIAHQYAKALDDGSYHKRFGRGMEEAWKAAKEAVITNSNYKSLYLYTNHTMADDLRIAHKMFSKPSLTSSVHIMYTN